MHAYTNEKIIGIIHASNCIHVQYIYGNHFRIIGTCIICLTSHLVQISGTYSFVMWFHSHCTFLAFRQMVLYIGVKPKDTAFF